MVALRKESVDRNTFWGVLHMDRWLVALRKESVDRNNTLQCNQASRPYRRSPQGERG